MLFERFDGFRQIISNIEMLSAYEKHCESRIKFPPLPFPNSDILSRYNDLFQPAITSSLRLCTRKRLLGETHDLNL